MPSSPAPRPDPNSTAQPRRHSRTRRATGLIVGFLVIWAAVAYLVKPAVWRRHAHRHPALDDVPGITQTGTDIPGDPVDVALVGTEAELVKIMLAAGWSPADALSLKSSLEIAV